MITYHLLLLLTTHINHYVLGGRKFRSEELKNVADIFRAKNNIALSEALDQSNSLFGDDSDSEEKKPTFYGPYYMYKGKVYKRKHYTKEPTKYRPNGTSVKKVYYSKSVKNTYSYRKSYSSFHKRTTTPYSYKNKTTFYGPYYMYKGKLFSRKTYTKEPTVPTVRTATLFSRYTKKPYVPWTKWTKFWETTTGTGPTPPPWNRTYRTQSYGPFFMFSGKVFSRRRFTPNGTLVPPRFTPPWMRTKWTDRVWTGDYPFTTWAYERIPVPDCIRKKPVGERVREINDFNYMHDSNPSLFSDLEISNITSLSAEALAYIAKHLNIADYPDSEMYVTLRPTIRQTYKHGFLYGKYPTVNWQKSPESFEIKFLHEIRVKHHQDWTLEMLRFSFDPNYSTTPIMRPPHVINSGAERFYC